MELQRATPYFRKTERTFNPIADPLQHGFSGPMHFAPVSSTGRAYPLCSTIKAARADVGGNFNADMNGGNPLGLGELNENWRDGLRRLASSAYPLSGVTVLPNTLVASVFLLKVNDALTAIGVQLSNGTKLHASREVLLATGAYRTPQLLMLSGIGPKAVLKKHRIAPRVEAPEVGRGLMDHMLLVEM